ncbi:MAG: hypothetical protein JNG86_18805 [Verrucomicrobiaceae bacterium]|nr:hypothetical protein [Verrucomicrobiaceae bacterium]
MSYAQPHGITLGQRIVPQTWTVVMTSDSGDYTLAGSVTSLDGNGNVFKPFTSASNQIVIEPDLWPRTGDRFTLEVNATVLDIIPALPELPPAPPPSAIKPEMDARLGLVYKTRPAHSDDLTAMKGIARVLEQRLHEFGIYTYLQIASWTDEHIREFSSRLAFKDRIHREKWVEQAKRLHAEKHGVNA